MVWTCIDGFKIPFPALIKIFIVMSCKGVDLPLLIVGLVCTEELLQKNFLELYLIPDGPWPYWIKPNFGYVFEGQRESFQLEQVHIKCSLLESRANFLKISDVCVWIFVFHNMKS